jgi:ribosomal protein L11 methyltransferase
MAFLSVCIRLDGLDAEQVEDACLAAGALSVTYTDQRDDAILEPAPGEFRLWPATRLEALFDAAAAEPTRLVALAARIGVPLACLELAHLADRAWEREWLRDFQPMRFGRRLWICPTASTPPAAADGDGDSNVIVRLDPGLAFGTGTHPTTALCLEWLEAQIRPGGSPGPRMTDYGCGSGILAIAALRLGAVRAAAFDIDGQALTATADNAAANGVAGALDIVARDADLPHDADLLVANILAGPLIELAPRFAELCRPGGRLALAGLLDEQAAEVGARYARWFEIAPAGRRAGWTLLAGSRRAEMSVRMHRQEPST